MKSKMFDPQKCLASHLESCECQQSTHDTELPAKYEVMTKLHWTDTHCVVILVYMLLTNPRGLKVLTVSVAKSGVKISSKKSAANDIKRISHDVA